MSASGWLIMAVRTCNPFQWETNAATVLSSPKRPGPRATSPPAWSQYLNHREGTLGSEDVRTHCNLLQTWWDEQKRRISTKLYGTLYWFCTSFLYLAVNSWGRWHNCWSNWWNVNGAAIKTKKNTNTPFELQDLFLFCFLKKRDIKKPVNGFQMTEEFSLWLISDPFCLQLL